MKLQKTLNSCGSPEKKNTARGIALPEFKATIIKTVWLWQKKLTHRPMEPN